MLDTIHPAIALMESGLVGELIFDFIAKDASIFFQFLSHLIRLLNILLVLKSVSHSAGGVSVVVSGGPLLSLVEPQRFIITRVYLTHYCKAKTDFVLLANKRWLGGESIKSLAQFFGLKEQTVKGYLWKLKNEPRFKTFYQQGTKE